MLSANLDENPIRTLLRMKEGRQGREFATVLVAFAVALGLLQSHPPGPATTGLVMMLGCLWLLHLVVIPTLVRPPDTTLLMTLRRGRCLEEMAGAGLKPAGIVDEVGLHALHMPLPWIVGGFGALFTLVLLPNVTPRGLELQSLGFALSLLFYPVLRVTGSYLAQMLAAWSGDSDRVTVAQLGVAGLVQGVGNVLAVFGLTNLFYENFGTATLQLLGALAWLILASRTLAILGLHRSDSLLKREATVAKRRPKMPTWLPPVLAREWLRDSVGLPGGIPTMLALNLVSLPVLLVWLDGGGASLLSFASQETLLAGMPLLALLAIGSIRAASRTLDGCLVEREAKTDELVTTTRLTTQEYLDNMAMVGWVPRVAEVLLSLALLVPFWILAGLPLAAPILLTLAVAAAMPLASYLALLCVPAGTNRRESAILAHLSLIGVLWFGGFMAYSMDATEVVPAALGIALVVLVVGRAVRFIALNPPDRA